MRTEELRGDLARAAAGVQVDTTDALAKVRVLGARRQRNQRIATGVACALVIAASAVAVSVVRDGTDSSRLVTEPAASAPIGVIDGRMIPATHLDGDSVVVPLTTPDGRHFELRYPRTVDIASLGLAVFATVDWPVTAGGTGPNQCCSREINFTYATIADLYPDAVPVAQYQGANGSTVKLFHAAQRRTAPNPYPTADYLVFQFGPWVAEVWDNVPADYAKVTPLDDAQRRTWASLLAARIDAAGFVVIEPQTPLRTGDPKTVQLAFGRLEKNASSLNLSQFYCDDPGSDTPVHRRFSDSATGGEGVAWCDATTGMHILAEGTTPLVDAIDTGLTIRQIAN